MALVLEGFIVVEELAMYLDGAVKVIIVLQGLLCLMLMLVQQGLTILIITLVRLQTVSAVFKGIIVWLELVSLCLVRQEHIPVLQALQVIQIVVIALLGRIVLPEVYQVLFVKMGIIL